MDSQKDNIKQIAHPEIQSIQSLKLMARSCVEQRIEVVRVQRLVVDANATNIPCEKSFCGKNLSFYSKSIPSKA